MSGFIAKKKNAPILPKARVPDVLIDEEVESAVVISPSLQEFEGKTKT